MFDLATTPFKFVGLLLLFTFCVGWWGYLVSRRQDVTSRVSNSLHLGMAVLMLAMVPRAVWHGLVASAGMPVLIATQVLSVAWFAALALRGHLRGLPSARLDVAHALMFVAMTWHLGAMAVMWASRGVTPKTMAAMVPGEHGMGHAAGTGMGEVPAAGMASIPGPGLLFTWVGLPIMAWLLWAGVKHLAGAFRTTHSGHRHLPAGGDAAAVSPGLERLGAVGHAAMLLGMFWMSTGLLTPLLPFFSVFAF